MLRLKSSFSSKTLSRPLDMTPMIDVVFLLLIFFILTSVFSRSEVLDLTLPEAAASQVQTNSDFIHLNIKTADRIYLGTEEMPFSLLHDALSKRLEKDKEKGVLLSADRALPFQDLVSVLDLLQALGVAHLSVAVETAEHPS